MCLIPIWFGVIWSILAKYGFRMAQNIEVLLNTEEGRKPTLLVKIFETDPEMKNFLYIGKGINGKFSILGLSDHFLDVS